ncbi:VanW family protein [Paenibacillus sp. GYB003]|uniref:VanW family protein n=1 Tax=Paenibacillus sp. GYB003 TaxID=2994392 RepID=UPI002F968ECF
MKAVWLVLLAALLQQPDVSDSLALENDGRNILTINRADFSLPGQTMVDTDKLNRLLDKAERLTYEAPKNAKFGDGGQIVPARPGRKLNREATTEQLYAYFYGSGPARAGVALSPVYPRVDGELLASVRQKQIGAYATYFNAGNKSRSHNIGLASKAIDSTVVFPGETFSFNRTVGKRTEEKGYLRAPVIVRGELSEGIGGGICQVSSTLFNAIDRAGLQIVQRYSHSRHVPYVPPGRDATVSWDGPDFVFRNAYNQPVLIRAFAGRGTMFVAVYSTDAIEYKPREVPGMSKRLPEEVPLETGVGH